MLGLGDVVILLLLLFRLVKAWLSFWLSLFVLLAFLNKPHLCRIAIETYSQIGDGLDYHGVVVAVVIILCILW